MIGTRIITITGEELAAKLGYFLRAGTFLIATVVLIPPLSMATVVCTFSERDLRSVCTSETDGDTVTRDSFDEFPEPDGDAWVVIDVNDDEVDEFDVHVYFDDDHLVPLKWRVVGDLDDFDLSTENLPSAGVFVDLAGDINDPTPRRHSAVISSSNNDSDYRGRLEGTNSGSILATGDGPSAYGLSVRNRSEHGDAEARALNKGTLETRGRGFRGIQARTDGPGRAIVINEGSVITRGGRDGDYPAHAITAVAGDGGTATVINSSGATVSTYGNAALALRARAGDSGTAHATNELGASVSTAGDAGRGVFARVDSGAGTAVATNRGSILTAGNDTGNNRAYGLYAQVDSADAAAEATAANSGTIETRGTGARGVRASVLGPGTALAVNEGSVTIRGGPSDNGFVARAVEADAEGESGTAQANNETGAFITTTGVEARGLVARAATAVATNKGTITTSGSGAYGANASADLVSGSAQAINDDGATISTTGVNGRGLQATGGDALAANRGVVLVTGDATENGTTFGVWAFSESTHAGTEARAVNHGTVETRGTRGIGMGASIQGSGTAVATNEGTIVTRGGAFVSGLGSHGMFAGTTDATALVTNRGTVFVGGPYAVGMFARARAAGTAQIVLDGGTVRASYDSATDDAEDGVGILGWSESGMITARIQRNATVEAPVAARFVGSPADVVVDGSTIMGAIDFDRFNDTLSVINSTFSGAIDFGGGLNTMVVQSSVFDGSVIGVTDMFVRGGGIARFNSDVTFSGSSATIEDGTLVFAGHFNLGMDGTMTVYDGARVTALLNAGNVDDPPRITAGGGIVVQDAAGNPADFEIYVQPDQSLDEATRGDQATLQRVAESVISTDTPVTAAGNQVTLKNEGQGGVTETIGAITIMADGSQGSAEVQSGAVLAMAESEGVAGASCAAPTAGGAGGPGVLLGALLHGGIDLFDLGADPHTKGQTTAAYKGASFGGNTPSSAGWSFTNWTSVRGNGPWTRNLGGNGPTWTARTPTVGFDARFGGNFSIDASASQELSMSSRHKGMPNQLDGGRYAVRARWLGEGLLAGASISRGQWRGHTAFANPVTGGGLTGAFDMNQTHAQAGVGARFDLGWVRMQPSATLFSGRLERDAYTARGDTFRANVPGIAHRYRGWSGTLRLSPSHWLNATRTVMWRPEVELKATRTHGAAASFALRQSARTGALGFTSLVRDDAMPRTVLALGMSVDAMISERWQLRVGYAGMLVDDEPEHGVSAGLRIHF
ncbi:MAG: hypothetical protein OXF11_14555 [Deltaproteobacteria bacterium]|nr:hypothetical protein [Deltaproteobacteria bacterium]